MTNPILFAMAASFLLLMPGPTNTLLLSSAAATDLRASLPLVLSEVLGYATAIALLTIGIGPILKADPALTVVFKLAAAGWLLFMAASLWLRGAKVSLQKKRVEPSRVFVATVLNPKALVFAFIIVPHLFDAQLAKAIPYLASLGFLIVTAGTIWVTLGALLGPAVSRVGGAGAAQRIGAAAQALFACILISSTLWK